MHRRVSGWKAHLGLLSVLLSVACGEGESPAPASNAPPALAEARAALTTSSLAAYDATRRAPVCASAGAGCDSGTLLNGRGPVGPERNAPNTLQGTCADGTSGTYRSDESLERLEVATQDGSVLASGKTVQVRATVWAWSGYTSDKLDVYVASNADAPSWTYLTTLTPTGAGSRLLTATYTLPAGPLQAVRGVFRYSGGPASCGSGFYTDNDDLVFAVQGAGVDTPPTVSLTAPASGATLVNTVSLSAQASDDVGVTRVEFYAGTSLVGTDTAAPFSVSWDTRAVASGAWSLTARAYDSAGQVTTSPAVSVTVAHDAAPPTVALTSPAGGAVLFGDVTLEASASDDVGITSVSFYRDGTWMGATYQGPPYRFFWPTRGTPNGTHALTAVAQDAAGNTTTSAAVTVTVDNDTVLPSAALLHPTAGQVTPGSVSLSASASDDRGLARLDFKVDGAVRCQLALAGETSVERTCAWSGAGGAHTVQVLAVDLQGNQQLTPSISFTADTSPPVAAFEEPQPGFNLRGVVPVKVIAGDDTGVVRTELYVDEALVATKPYAPATFSWDTLTVANGSHTLQVKAVDAAGNVGASPRIGVTVDNDFTAPTVQVAAPLAGQVLTGLASLSAQAQDAVGVTGLELYLDGTLFAGGAASGSSSATYSAPWDSTTASEGPHELSARAVDAAGNVGLSNAVTFYVDRTPPSVAIDSPVTGTEVIGEVPVEVSAADAYGVGLVELVVDGVVVGSASTVPSVIPWDTSTSSGGVHLLTARATDAAGNVTESAPIELTVRVDPPPAVSVRSPGETVSGQVYVEALVEGGTPLARLELRVDSQLVGSFENPPTGLTVFPWDTRTTRDGVHQLWVSAFEANGRVTHASPVPVTVANDQQPPVVHLSVSDGYTEVGDVVQGTVFVNGNAWDDSGFARLELYLDGELVGWDSGEAPMVYLPWDTLTVRDGVHTLELRAYDQYEKPGTTSRTLTVANDTQPPMAHLSVVGSDGFEVYGDQVRGQVSVRGYGYDDRAVARVELLLDGQAVASATSEPFYVELPWDTLTVPDGLHTLEVRVEDTYGKVGTATRTLTVANDLQPPMASLSLVGSDGFEVYGDEVRGQVSVRGYGYDDTRLARLELLLDGQLVASAASEPFFIDFPWDTLTVRDGVHTLELRAYDQYEKLGTATRTLSVANDLQPPMAHLAVYGSDGFELYGDEVQGTVTLRGYGYDDTQVARVELLLDGQPVASTTSEPFFLEFPWDSQTKPNGSHTFELWVEDTYGKTSSMTRTLNVNNGLPPTPVFIFSPAEGTSVSGTVSVGVAAQDTSLPMTRVDLLVDGVPVASALNDPSSPESIPWDSTAHPDGAHTLVARAHGQSGVLGDSEPVSVVVSNGQVPGLAVWDAARQAPGCAGAGDLCSTGALVVGRATEGGEPHAPNTLQGGCADTAAGGFHDAPALDRLRISTPGGAKLAPGQRVNLDALLWATADTDALDVYVAADADSPQWTFVATVSAGGTGARQVGTSFTLPEVGAGAVQAVRGVVRQGGVPASCAPGADHDDLFFAMPLP